MKSASPNKAELVNDCAEKIALLDSWGADEVEPRFSALDMSMMATTSLPSRKDRLKHLKRAIGRGANIGRHIDGRERPLTDHPYSVNRLSIHIIYVKYLNVVNMSQSSFFFN